MTSTGKPAPPLSDSVFEMFSLKGKVAAITGASGGIGLEVTKAFAEAGADVALLYNTNKKTNEYANEVRQKYGVKAKAYQCPVNNFQTVSDTLNAIVKEFGHLDIVVANAGVPSEAPLLDESMDAYKKVTSTNIDGVVYVAKVAGAIFKKQGKGNMIITASMSGHVVNVPQLQATYNMTKAACIQLAKSLAIEWKDFARVNSVSPGYIITPISNFVNQKTKEEWHTRIPLGREADPRELKGAYLYFASDASTYTTGADLLVDGGYTVL